MKTRVAQDLTKYLELIQKDDMRYQLISRLVLAEKNALIEGWIASDVVESEILKATE